MKRFLALLLISALCCLPHVLSADENELWCDYPPGPGAGAGKHIVLISGDEEYRSEEALPMLGKILAQRHGYRCTVLFAINPETGEIDPNNQNNIPGLDKLNDADLVIMALRFRCLPDEQMKYFDEYLMSGRPIIALRTSTHAFRNSEEIESSYPQYGGNREWQGGFGKQVLGETWVNHHGHHGQQSCRGVVNEDLADHVLLRGVNDVWGPTDVYGIRELPDNSQVLLYGQVIDGMLPEDEPVEGEQNDPMMPLAWTRTWNNDGGSGNAIFCTTMGAATDFESAGLRRLVVNTAYQMTGLETAITDSLNVDYVDPYEPTNFGFDGFRKSMRPVDYDLKAPPLVPPVSTQPLPPTAGVISGPVAQAGPVVMYGQSDCSSVYRGSPAVVLTPCHATPACSCCHQSCVTHGQTWPWQRRILRRRCGFGRR
ncbi:MAG: ThuA domain-containing protein [Pirellulaceae bacterium]